jgi:hypothetical protein
LHNEEAPQMAEFTVEPEHVAGYSTLAFHSSLQALNIGIYVSQRADADSGYTGVMSALRPIVDGYAETARERMDEHDHRLHTVHRGLEDAALSYAGMDAANADNLDQQLPRGETVPAEPAFPNAVPYPSAVNPLDVLEPPAERDADIRALLDETGGLINGIDDVVHAVTGFSPVEAIVEPVSGDWTSLQRAAEALTNAATASNDLATNLVGSLGTLGQHWTGGAADAATTYVTNVAEAIREEAPLHRTVARVYEAVAVEMERVAQFIVDRLGDAADRIARVIASNSFPIIGQLISAYNALRAIPELVEAFREARDLVNDVRDLIEQAQAVIEIARDPVGAIQGEIEERLEPITERVEQARDAAQLVDDLSDLADPSEFEDAPDGDLSLGGDLERSS